MPNAFSLPLHRQDSLLNLYPLLTPLLLLLRAEPISGCARDERGVRVPGVGRASVLLRRPSLSDEWPSVVGFALPSMLQSLLARRKVSLSRLQNAPKSAQHHLEDLPVSVVSFNFCGRWKRFMIKLLVEEMNGSLIRV